MKFFVAFVVVTMAVAAYGLTLTDDQKSRLKANSAACKASSGVDQALIDKLVKEKKGTDGDAKFDAWIDCMWRKSKFANADGSINLEKLKSKIPANKTPAEIAGAKAAIEECSKIKDGIATVRKVAKCLHDKRQSYLASQAA